MLAMAAAAAVALCLGVVVDRDDMQILPPLTGNLGLQPPYSLRGIIGVSNLTGNPRTIFESREVASRLDSHRAPPTSAWWQDLILSNRTTNIINGFPLLIRAVHSSCTLQVAEAQVFQNASNTAESYTPFASSIAVTIGSGLSCYPHVSDHDYFSVNATLFSTTDASTPVGGLLLTRGHPYATLRVDSQPVSIFLAKGVATVSRLPVPAFGSINVTAEYIDVVDKDGDRWLVSLPSSHSVVVTSSGVILVATVTGHVRVSHITVPVQLHTGAGGNLANGIFEELRQNADCMVYGGSIRTNHTDNTGTARPYGIRLQFDWKVTPAGCTPLMVSMPHHRSGNLAGPTATDVEYESILGTLKGVLGSQWDMAFPLEFPSQEALSLADYAQCTQVELFNALLEDLKNVGNGTMLANDDYGLQMYHASLTSTTAKRLTADSQYKRLIGLAERWIDELSDGVLVYDTLWGVLCTDRNTNSAHETCFGESHIMQYGQILQALVRLWDFLLDEADSSQDRVRMFNKLVNIAYTLARDIANLSEEDEYFPVARGFDFYTGLAWDTTAVRPRTTGRTISPVGTTVLAYNGIAMLGTLRLNDASMALSGELLLSLEVASAKEYLLTAKDVNGTDSGLIVSTLETDRLVLSDDVLSIAPFDSTYIDLITYAVDLWEAYLPSGLLERLGLTGTSFDLMLLSAREPDQAVDAYVSAGNTGLFNFSNSTLDTQVSELEATLMRATNTSGCSGFSLPIRVLGTTIWYNNSFNYMFKVMDYQPTVIGQKPTSYNIYDVELYGGILKRDLLNIKSLGFNTVLISTATYSIDAFIELCKELDLNVIVAQILPETGFTTEQFIAESDFVKTLQFLSNHSNVVMWSVDSDALNSLSEDTTVFEYYVLLHKLRLLRDRYDTKLRPIVIPVTEFTVPALTQNKELYDKAVEVAMLTSLDVKYESIKETIEYLAHPVIMNFQSDSWNHVNFTDDEQHQADFLREQMSLVLPLHALQLLSGVSVSEWVDQFWRGETSDPDFDCPDPSNFRHSVCGARVAEFYDGMLTIEYMGINSQHQTWFKHCLRHKAAYYMLRSLLSGYDRSDDGETECVFVNLTTNFWWIIIIITGVCFTMMLLLVIFVLCSRERAPNDAFDLEDTGETRWVQADTDEIYELITNGTSILLDQSPFSGMNIQKAEDDMGVEDDDEVEVDSWDFCRWQVVIIQLDHLQKLIFDEMLCQLKCGDYDDVGEHVRGFETAVTTLHKRYMNSYLGWYDAQKFQRNAALGSCSHVRWEVQFGAEEDPVFMPLKQEVSDDIEESWHEGLDDIEFAHDGREYELIIDAESDASRNMAVILDKYRMEGDYNPIGTAYRRVRLGLGDTANDKLIDLLIMLSLWHLGEQMTWFNGHWLAWQFHYVMKYMKFPPTTVVNDARHFEKRTVTMDDINESCALVTYFDIEGTRGVDENDNFLHKDGLYNESELGRYPFRKTFREPRKWGVVFSVIHNIYFIVHTQLMSFIFWGFVVNISARDDKLADLGISGMFDRMQLIFFHSPDDLLWIMTTCAKFDFWLVVLGELMDVWMLGGLMHYQKQDWKTTFVRVRLFDYVKLRWSAYSSVIAFLILMGDTFTEDKHKANGLNIIAYVGARVAGIVLNNLILVLFPIKLRGAPRHGQKLARKGAVQQFVGSFLFWGLVYSSVQLFQAWIMFRTETVSWDFCGCDDDWSDIVEIGAGDYVHDFFGRFFKCMGQEPRCFSAVFLIWFTCLALFVVVVNAGFLVWTVLFGSFTHFASQWTSRKARSLIGKKIQTAYILRTLNVKMLGFTDPRDTQVARKVWNRVIKEMWDEYLISAFEYENLLIHTHVSEVQFSLKNAFAMERLSNFLEYIQAIENEELGPCASYPSVTILVPVYGEDLVCAAANTQGAFNEKIRSHQQEQTQLSFLVENYHDEWVNFVEHCVLDEEFFHDVLTEEQVDQMQSDVDELKVVTDEKVKRDMKGDRQLRNAAATVIVDRIHTQPHLFYEEELVAVQWWASMHMQTVARTIRGMERKREAFRFLLELEQAYTQTEKTRKDKTDLLTDDKFQVLLALQNLANNKWFSKNEQGLVLIWQRYPKVEVTFVVETLNYRNSPTVVRKVHEHVADLWDCTRFLSCLALWDWEYNDWYVVSAYARRNPLRLEKKAKYGLNGLMQGKAVNQAHSLMFSRGQLVQAIDANQDGYFDEALKLRSVLGKFYPFKDRSWSRHKIVGFPEYSITVKSGTVGRIAGYAEYIFVNMFQKVLAHPLGVRMHYGHPDFFDFSWILTQGGMSKSNPLINLNEDIFAGYHVTAQGETVDHVSSMRDGKGRETNFDGANGFMMKLAFGASMQYRTRDQFELMRTSDVLKRHSIFYGSVGPYIYIITIVVLIYGTLFINIGLTYSYKTDYSLSSRGSPYGSEWMIQMSLVETVPLLLQLVLDYGFAGFFDFLKDVFPATLYFLFVLMTRFSYFIQSTLSGTSSYIATGRSDPLFRRSLRHMFRYYGSTHFMPGMFLFMLVWLYMDIEPRPIIASLWRTFWHWGVALAFIVTPVVFNPSLDLKGLWVDLKGFYLWVFGETIERLKKQKDVLTKHAVAAKKNKFWEKSYEQLARKFHPGFKKDGDEKPLVYHNDISDTDYSAVGNIDGFGDEVDTEGSDELLQPVLPWAENDDFLFNQPEANRRISDFSDDGAIEAVEFGGEFPEVGTMYPRRFGDAPTEYVIAEHGDMDFETEFNPQTEYAEHRMPADYNESVLSDDVATSTCISDLPPPPAAPGGHQSHFNLLGAATAGHAVDDLPTPTPPPVPKVAITDEDVMSPTSDISSTQQPLLPPPQMQELPIDDDIPPPPVPFGDLPPPPNAGLGIFSPVDFIQPAVYEEDPSTNHSGKYGWQKNRGASVDIAGTSWVSSSSGEEKENETRRFSSHMVSTQTQPKSKDATRKSHVSSFPDDELLANSNSNNLHISGIRRERSEFKNTIMPPPHREETEAGNMEARTVGAKTELGEETVAPSEFYGNMEARTLGPKTDVGEESVAWDAHTFGQESAAYGNMEARTQGPKTVGDESVAYTQGNMEARTMGPKTELGEESQAAYEQYDRAETARSSGSGSSATEMYNTQAGATSKPSNVPSLTFDKLDRARGTAASYRTSRGDSISAGDRRKHGRLRVDAGFVNDEEDEINFDFDWLQKHEKNKAELDKYLKVFKRLPGRQMGANFYGGKVPNKVIEWKEMQRGFMKLGKVVDDATCKELLLGLGLQEVDFVQFVICFHKAEGVEAGHADYGIDRAVTDINRARHRELRHIQEQLARGKRGFLKTKDDSEKLAALTVLHNTRREFKVKFQDSTEDKSVVKANSLKHHWKVTMILAFRRCATIGAFIVSLLLLALWCFCFFSLWQDVAWEVAYLVVAITWDFLLTMSAIGPVVLVTRVTVAAFMIYRIIVMVQVDNIFYPTFCLTYALIHCVLDVQFSFWSCFGPYILRRQVKKGKDNPKTLDDQREVCLIMLLKDNRERYLWGFPYYFFARQLLALIIGLIQFAFGVFLLIIRSIIEGLKYLATIMDGYHHRRNPTESTYIADKKNLIQEDECKGPPVNRWTNTVRPSVAHKMCQVTNPNVRNEYNQVNVIDLPGRDADEIESLPPPPTLPNDSEAGNMERQKSTQLLGVDSQAAYGKSNEPMLLQRRGSKIGRSNSISRMASGGGVSNWSSVYGATLDKTGLLGFNQLSGWRDPRDGPSPPAHETNPQSLGSGLFKPPSMMYTPRLTTPRSPVKPEDKGPAVSTSAAGPSFFRDPDEELSVVDFGDKATTAGNMLEQQEDLQTSVVYFGDGDQINFVPTEAFQSVLEFRRGIKIFYRFPGDVKHVRLEILGQEILDYHDWPFLNSRNCFVQVFLDAPAPRERKTAIHARSELRGMTELESRLADNRL
ncbi:putative callose synthase 8 [Diplonema papillatum]|nr:putative callose synthase 8 [Diplonema papillatum]